ncbi:transporter substrate-binding domain-containing protein [Aminobacter aminovorans]|uniref:ABC chain amino acid transporter, periplasmic ligand binding protein n=1 Tax=Aminobacter aminovorans TaxID=83263 RepID=A0AAC8YW51_AMIAI|nr:transporter substrate-binding domain-containing protein [Aminobacter aminovorans]AMS45545.1 ABC chain amino acid transporter, periplasmic ligand binding protein [Aminobacter aminovorans]MBB3708621.1 polar amino acid transport system substrate-binding protein [Aminobacter aminovorans]
MPTFAYLIEPPFNYRDADETVTGCDVELARTILGMVGARDLEMVENEFAQLLPGLAEGRWRMTTGLFATDERRQIAAFSRPIWALPDGLLVQKDNLRRLTGYRSVAETDGTILAVIRNQLQHRSAAELGVPDDRILVFETYADAARAVADGRAHAYASVARAHGGFLERHPGTQLTVVAVGADEKQPAFGSFAFARSDDDFRRAVDGALLVYLGSREHRRMMKTFGFSDAEVDLIAG